MFLVLLFVGVSAQAQMWLRVGDERGAKGDSEGQTQAYRRALEADPRLQNDPAFRVRFEKLYLERKLKQQPEIRKEKEEEKKQDEPVRTHRWLGAVGAFGPEDAFAVGPTVFLWQHLQLTASFGVVVPGFTADVRWVWLQWQISPFISAGIHVPFGGGWTQAEWTDLWRSTFIYATAGAQWVSTFGLYVHAGISFVPSLDSQPGRLDWPRLLPAAGVGWLADL